MTEETRSQSFGSIASAYERYRSGPPSEEIDWMLPSHTRTVVDLGAGTGALTRLLVPRAEVVIAVEPDERMRTELAANVPDARAVAGRGDSIPLPDGSADAVLASASWHWMDPIPTLHEVARVLAPGGWLGAVWAGPDPEGPLLLRAKELLARGSGGRSDAGGEANQDLGQEEFSALIQGNGNRPEIGLVIPKGPPLSSPSTAGTRGTLRSTPMSSSDSSARSAGSSCCPSRLDDACSVRPDGYCASFSESRARSPSTWHSRLRHGGRGAPPAETDGSRLVPPSCQPPV